MTITVGVFEELSASVDCFWEQCDGPYGHHRGLHLRARDRDADHILVINLPWAPGERPALSLGDRVRGNLRGDISRRKLVAAWEHLDVPREKTTVLFHEPPTYVKDMHFEVAREFAGRVYGPDERAQYPMRLGTHWIVLGDRESHLAAQPREKTEPLACVVSGKQMLPGHAERLEFMARLRRAGIDFSLFGGGLPEGLGGRGSVRCKAAVLRPARYTLALENYAEGDFYVTKAWDALLCWSLPLYWGSRAIDAMIPEEAFIRLPDLQEGGVAAVEEALAHPEWWEQRREAMAEARKLILGDLRLVEWFRKTVVEG